MNPKHDLSFVQRLKKRLLGLSPLEASFDRRGFPGVGSAGRPHLEEVIRAFIVGYETALLEPDMREVAHRLDSSFSSEFVGFAYEGTGLYFSLADLIFPKIGNRLHAFTHTVAPHHDFITMVGAGFAVARVPFAMQRFNRYRQTLDPMNAWCMADGYGFHQGFFYWRKFVLEGREGPESFDLQNRRLFDAGVGRSMWWVFGADPQAIASAISRCNPNRQAEMWAGIGTALCYAGGGTPAAPSLLFKAAGEYRYDFLSGIPLAAHMRDKGGNRADWTESVCLELLGSSSAKASQMVIAELETFLKTWEGSEQDKWNHCYIGLRERIKRNLLAGQSEQTGARSMVHA